jgi:glycosyltransferase involved in cell wall biosynthesis
MKNILYIAPIPPPINGQSKANNIIYKSLLVNNNVHLINLSKSSLKSGSFSLKRVVQIFSVFYLVFKYKSNKDVIYLSLAESTLGNIRDIVIYLICFNKLDKLIIHMLGGAGMKAILSKDTLIKRVNVYFFNKLNSVIVEGEVNYIMFSEFILKSKVHIIPNFVEDYLFFNDDEIFQKFNNVSKIQILYLSNLIKGKGYEELLAAFFQLKNEIKEQVNIVFVGDFESIDSKNKFIEKVESHKSLNYLGSFIDGFSKRDLFSKSHIFCLPTYYPFEGQPISILEAYATGCIVVTTSHSGIPFIFSHLVNGYEVKKKSPQSIVTAITYLVENKHLFMRIGNYNKNYAFSNFQTKVFENRIKTVLNLD